MRAGAGAELGRAGAEAAAVLAEEVGGEGVRQAEQLRLEADPGGPPAGGDEQRLQRGVHAHVDGAQAAAADPPDQCQPMS